MTLTLTKRKKRTDAKNGVPSPRRTATKNGVVLPQLPVRVVTEQNPEGFTIPESALTLQGFREWSWSDEFPREGRISFIDGEVIFDMSQERIESHVKVKTETSRVLSTINAEEDLGEFLNDGAGVTNLHAHISVVPDAVFATWESFEQNRVRWVPSKALAGDFLELEGTPDWLLEVVSPSSVGKDTAVLFKGYHKAGIPEYWLIDARGDEIEFTIFRHAPKGYEAQPVKNGWQFSPVFGRHFRLKRTKNRLGGWRYQLEVRK